MAVGGFQLIRMGIRMVADEVVVNRGAISKIAFVTECHCKTLVVKSIFILPLPPCYVHTFTIRKPPWPGNCRPRADQP